jgi:hypothetical protein
MIDFLFIAVLQAAAGDPQVGERGSIAAQAEDTTPESVRERRERHRLRCRDETVLGSRISQRVCMSRAQREEIERESRAIADKMQGGAWDRCLPGSPGCG